MKTFTITSDEFFVEYTKDHGITSLDQAINAFRRDYKGFPIERTDITDTRLISEDFERMADNEILALNMMLKSTDDEQEKGRIKMAIDAVLHVLDFKY